MQRGILQLEQLLKVPPRRTARAALDLSSTAGSDRQPLYFDNLLHSVAFSQKSPLSFHALAHCFFCNHFIFTYLSKMPGVTPVFITPMASPSVPATPQMTLRIILPMATSNHARGRGFTTGAGCRSVTAPGWRRSPRKKCLATREYKR